MRFSRSFPASIFLFSSLVLAPVAALADPQAELRELISPQLAPLIESDRVVGCVVGVLRGDEALFVGFGEFERGGAPPAGDTIFEIGSITKALTGTLLAEMSLRGEAAIDGPLQDYLPEGVTAPQKGDQPIRLVHLATHTSGLPRLPDNLILEEDQDPLESNPYADYGADEAHAFLAGHELRRPPGEAEYSNLGMGLLGHVLAQRAGKSYEALLVERIAGPLGMADTRITLNRDQLARFAPPYAEPGEPGRRWDFDVIAGAGAVRSTAADLLKLAAAGIGGGDQPIHKALAVAFQKRPGFGSGLGWQIAGDGVTRWHNGQTGGYSGALFIVPTAQTAVVLLSNTACDATTTVAEKVTQTVLGMRVAPVKLDQASEVDERVLRQYVGKYVLAPGVVFDITLKEGRLMAKLTGQSSYPIYAASETEFFYKVVDAQITFERNDQGAVEKLILHQGGIDQSAKRVRHEGHNPRPDPPATKSREADHDE